MKITRRIALSALLFSAALSSLSSAQSVIATVPVEGDPAPVAVNTATNKIFVANYCGNDPSCQTHYGTVTIIDGTTFSTATVAVGIRPADIVINPVTNKAYVFNQCGNDPTCETSSQTVTVIDGVTLSTTSLPAGFGGELFTKSCRSQRGLAINAVTNRTYVGNQCGSDYNCDPSSGPFEGTVSVIAGAQPTALQFVALTPCRVVDTRNGNGLFGGRPFRARLPGVFHSLKATATSRQQPPPIRSTSR